MRLDQRRFLCLGQHTDEIVVRDEVESRELFLFLFEVVVQSLLARLDDDVQVVQNFEAALGAADFDAQRVLGGIQHQFLPLQVALFETLGVFRQLGTDIVRLLRT